MELGGPGSPSGLERRASGELASAFSGLTTTSTQLGQGQAPAKRKTGQLGVQLGGLHQGRNLPQENALALPMAKRRCVSTEDLPNFQEVSGAPVLGFPPAPAAARFPAPPVGPAFGPPACMLPQYTAVQHPLHRYNLRSCSGSGPAGATQRSAAAGGGPVQSAARRSAGAAPRADRGHLLSTAAGGDCGHLLPGRGGGFHQPVLAGVQVQPVQPMQPVQVQHPAGFGLPPLYPGRAAGQPSAAKPAVMQPQHQQQPRVRRGGAGAPAALAAVAAAGAAAAAAGAVAAAASVSQGASSLARMLQQPAAAKQGHAQPQAAAQPAAMWPGAARGKAPKTVPAAAPPAFPAYPAPAVMSSAAHVAFSDSQEDSVDTHTFMGGSLEDDFNVMDDGPSSSGDDEDWVSPCSQEGFHSARSHPSVLRELPPEEGRWADNHQQQQGASKRSSSPAAQAAAAPVPVAVAAPAPGRKPHARELERLLHAELRAANEALCAVSFPENCAFCPVHEADCMIPLCVAFNIPPISIALGASYFQRLLARAPDMLRHARAEGFFVRVPTVGPSGEVEQAVMMRCPNTACDLLRLVYLACIYLGAKVGDRVRYTGQLSSMMKALVGHSVSSPQAAELEMHVLECLDWRLGPFFDLGPDGGF